MTHLEIGQIDGYLSRTYTNQGTGATVSLLIVGGKPGPISVHTPDICFSGAGYELKNTPMQTSITPEDDPSLAVEVFSADFKKATDSTAGLKTALGQARDKLSEALVTGDVSVDA